jgi:hypothetical protein
MKINKLIFFTEYRKKLDQNLTLSEVDAIDDFIDMVNAEIDYFSIPEWAYVFATVFHETAQTFLPVIEAFWKSEEWRKRNFRYYPFYGRGFVQLTWERNYKLYTKLLKIDLINKPELACEPRYAFKILIDGCKFGRFTGVGLGKYLKNGKPDYKNMRRVINGTDKAELIEEYAYEFKRILNISNIEQK